MKPVISRKSVLLRGLFRAPLVLFVLVALFTVGCGESSKDDDPETGVNCDLSLSSPALVFTGTEDYSVDGTEYTRYKLEVTNSDDFPDELFAASPDLPACGLNTSASRTWVDIYNGDDDRLYGFCALGSSDDLNALWFSLPKGDRPPSHVYIVMEDRACDKKYTSNSVQVGPECYTELPAPQLELTGTENYTVGDVEYTRYKLNVTNRASFPSDLFDSAPHLPACGLNTSSARTWVDIYNNDNERLYGFCALESPDNLGSIWFSVPKTQRPPQSAYIVLHDRECDVKYTSNSVPVVPCYTDLPTPQLVYTGKQDYTLDGNPYTRYTFDVTNKADFPDELFAPAPYLPACGLNTSASRTWVDIFNNEDVRLYGFCGLGTAANLGSIWFALPKNQLPPRSVYIVLTDRLCGAEYRSNPVAFHDVFVGNWVNENMETDHITRIDILLGTDLDIQAWGACTPDDCDWGIIHTLASDALDGQLNIIWDQGFAVRNQSLELVTLNRMKVITAAHFTDGRPDYTRTEYFIK